MKKLLITLGLFVLTLTSARAQGTINFANGFLARITVADSSGGTGRNLTAADGFLFSAWFGPAGTTDLVQAPGEFGISAITPGVIDAPSVFALPGTETGEVVSLEIRARDSAFGIVCRTGIRQVTLGPAAGPGTFIWSNNPSASRFMPLIIAQCPEPSTLALGALGVVLSLVGARRRMVK